MPVVGFSELRKHAVDQQYRLAFIHVQTLPVARGILERGTALDAPLVLAVNGSELTNGLLPAVEALAQKTPVPVALVASDVRNAEQATQAIRLGCNALVIPDGLDDDSGRQIRAIAASCGIDVIDQADLANSLHQVDAELESGTIDAIDPSQASWRRIEQQVAAAAAEHLSGIIESLQATGKGKAALLSVKPWRPVEHLIIYNTTTDDAASAALAAEGRRVLDRIPGVRATWSGRSINAEAGYRWCWLIRFAHADVIDSYREHPDHIAYADKHFRPAAGDRISIDYELTGADET